MTTEITGGVQARASEQPGWRGRGRRTYSLTLDVTSGESEAFEELAEAITGAPIVFRIADDGTVTATIQGGRLRVPSAPATPPAPASPPIAAVDPEAELLAYFVSAYSRSLVHMHNVMQSVPALRPHHLRDPRAREAFAAMLRHPSPSSSGAADDVIADYLLGETTAQVEIGQWLRSLRTRIDATEALEIARRLVCGAPDDDLPRAA